MRLLKRVEYEAVYGAGQRRSSPQFSVFFRAHAALPKDDAGREAPREDFSESAAVAGTGAFNAAGARGTSRFGISVKKALGGAVVRNRIKRRVREILRRNRTEIPTGWDIVIHPKSSVAGAAFAPLEAELVRLLRSITTSGLNTGWNNPPNTTRNAARNNSQNTAQNTIQKSDQKPGRNTGPKG